MPNLWLLKAGSMIGGSTFGNPQITIKAPTEDKAPNKIVNSNMIGTNAGKDHIGLPPMIRGQSLADAHHVNQVPNVKPAKPKINVTHGIYERGIPIASSISCNGNGE